MAEEYKDINGDQLKEGFYENPKDGNILRIFKEEGELMVESFLPRGKEYFDCPSVYTKKILVPIENPESFSILRENQAKWIASKLEQLDQSETPSEKSQLTSKT